MTDPLDPKLRALLEREEIRDAMRRYVAGFGRRDGDLVPGQEARGRAREGPRWWSCGTSASW
jgi:hypothetical protein